MKPKNSTSSRIKIEDLVLEELKIDLAPLASFSAKNGASGDRVEAGLHEFMRQWLERSLATYMPESAWNPRSNSLKPEVWLLIQDRPCSKD